MRRWLVLLILGAGCHAATNGNNDAAESPNSDLAISGDAAGIPFDAAINSHADGGAMNGGFAHPGILVNQAQLDFVKAKIAAGIEPWKSAFTRASNSNFGSLNYTPHAIAVVQCGPYSNPDIGCSDEKNDSEAAYTQALLWYFSGNPQYAHNAIAIMNAWSAVLTGHQLSNAPLQSAWVASVFPRAAEIIRYSNAGWSATDIAAFSKLLRDVYLPEVVNGSDSNGNWELSMSEATIAIGVFLDDRPTFEAAISMWKKRVPAYLYMSSDGATPLSPPTGNKTGAALKTFWYNPTKYVDGLCQETCRDLGHVQYGLAAMINAAETARIQNVDLYATQANRIMTGLELAAGYLSGDVANSNALCGVNLNADSPDPMWEIAYNELVNRLMMPMPETAKLIAKIRPTGSDHHMQWETLTHAEVGSVGIP
jgi:hypothetical protein